jgi:hypothetical protein
MEKGMIQTVIQRNPVIVNEITRVCLEKGGTVTVPF